MAWPRIVGLQLQRELMISLVEERIRDSRRSRRIFGLLSRSSRTTQGLAVSCKYDSYGSLDAQIRSVDK
jgi:hypothetical protein